MDYFEFKKKVINLFPFFDKKRLTKAEKGAKGLKIYKSTEQKGEMYTVHVDGSLADVQKWMDLFL
jgi:hypothetical protein